MTGLQVLSELAAELGSRPPTASPRGLPTIYVLNTYCVPGTILGTKGTSVNKSNIPVLGELTL